MIPRLRPSSASSHHHLDCYFITPPAPILGVIPANWQECDEKPRNLPEFVLIHQPAPPRSIREHSHLASGSVLGFLSSLNSFLEFLVTRRGAGQSTRGASNKKACQILHCSPIYPSWREGSVQVAQQWGKQKGTSETEKA